MLTIADIDPMTDEQRRAELILRAEQHYNSTRWRKHLAEDLGVKPQTARKWATKGHVPAYPLLWLSLHEDLGATRARLDRVLAAVDAAR